MRRHLIILAVLLAPTLGAATTRPSAAVDPAGCVTAECHVNIKAAATLHGPTANNSCLACHEVVDPAVHTFRPTRSGPELCTYCHEFDVSAMPVIHKPVALGQCVGCHDPHGGRDHSLTRESSMSALCYRCHEDDPSDHQVLHTPLKQGQCTSCHPPHASMFPKLLDAVGSDLCLACHDKLDASLAAVRSRHKALEKGCEKCHDAHGSSLPMQLTASPAELCQGCHEPIKQRIASSLTRHSAATEGRACLSCHTPHGSDAVSLLSDQPIVLCMGCHKDAIKTAQGRTVPAVVELTSNAMHKHGALKDGECGGCHEPHGTAQPMLLTSSYSTAIYQSFSLSQYQLCFKCHDQRLVTSSSAGTMTKFRDGDRNLHWVHVKEDQRGRSCAMCHTTHASANERNICETVPLQTWKMPIRFEITPTGGSCAPGCHKPWSYDRDRAVNVPATQPAEEIEPPAPRSRAQEPFLIALDATDTTGRQIRIPASQPSVIAFTRDDPRQVAEMTRQLESAISDVKVNLILIISGTDAGSSIESRQGNWSAILDPDGNLSAQLQVHGWPMTMVVQADGLKVAQLTGAASSLALKLPVYLDLAAGTLDRAAVERVLRHPVVARDGEPNRLERNLYEARRLLDKHQPAEALRLLNESLGAGANSLPLRIELVQGLLALNRADEALAMLQTIDSSALPPGQHDLLRARALLAKYHWVDARNLLLDVVRRYPDLAEAHYLLGSLYERDNQWQKAAEEYRAASQGGAGHGLKQ